MAKQQGVSLNPSKLSGQCGRLKCCLRYELSDGKGVTHGGAHGEGSAAPAEMGCAGCSAGPGPAGACAACGCTA